jgi:hypothetical protein
LGAEFPFEQMHPLSVPMRYKVIHLLEQLP